MPAADHHVHLWSPEGADALVRLKRHLGYPPEPDDSVARTAERLVSVMDSSGVQRAVVLSVAYWFGSEGLQGADEATQVRRENQWLADAVRRFPGRLTGFCGLNPLREYALAEVARCADDPHLTGLKLHFPNSAVELGDPDHVAHLVAVFEAANRHGLPLVVHLWTPAWEADHEVARRDAEVFVQRLVAAAPAVPVQVAHLGGGGAFSPATDVAIGVFADAIAAGQPLGNLYFDIAAVLHPQHPAEAKERIVQRLRELGLDRILYGSDGAAPAGDDWQALRRGLALTAEEFRIIRSNVAPYLR